MKIINVGNFDYKNHQRVFFHTSQKLSHGLIRLGHSVYAFSDRDVARQNGFLNSRKLGVSGANRDLLETCINIQPDLLLLGHADVIQPETLERIRSRIPAIRIAQWNYDALYVEDNIKRLLSKINVVDITFVSTAGEAMKKLIRPNRAVAYLPNPVDKTMETGRAFAKNSHSYDMFFGMRNGRNYRRWDGQSLTGDEVAALLRAGLPDFRLCLPGLESSEPIYGMEYLGAMESSLMGLALSQESNQPFYASDRTAHMSATGLLTFIDGSNGFDQIYSSDEIVLYQSSHELFDKARYFKTHQAEARAIAERGWQRTHAVFNSSRVARYLLEQVLGETFSEDYEWPTERY